MSNVALTCQSVGYSCEWALRVADPEEAVRRFADHAKCAHGVPELGEELRHRVLASLSAA